MKKYATYLVLYVFFLTIGLVATYAQVSCDHLSDSFERFANIRLLPPAKITYYDGRTVEYVMQNARETRIDKFEITPDTVIQVAPKKGDLVWMIFCIKDDHLYTIIPLTPAQSKSVKPNFL